MKKLISLILVFCMLAVLSPLASFAAVVNTVYVSEQIASESTIYLGEIVLDGETVLTYLYSDGPLNLLYYFGSAEMDQKTSEIISAMGNTAFYELISDRWDQARTETYDYYVNHVTDVEPNVRLCSDESLTAGMDGTWSSASAVAALLYPDAAAVSESSENVYDIDEGFAAALDAYDLERTEYVDEPIASDKRVIMTTGINAENDNVYYTVEDGQVVKHVDTYIVYDCAAITVIYTSVELSTGSALTGDINGDGTVDISDVTALLNVLDGSLAQNDACDLNGDDVVDVSDVTAILNMLAA